ncbi:MAG TPA: nicotinate-nucleotide--dimethylbenzimidazole phosphoribosyltransferase [Steroidobacteraceae bacterium]|jgi:nicotinate-nucleotide--dimethylbenzimidazole phosphoribosyltransferase
MRDRWRSREVRAPDVEAGAAARSRQQQLTKPPGSLGRLEDLACWLAARLRSPMPVMPRSEIFVFAADHGVAARGVSAFPQSVTAQMLGNFASGGAAINVLASLEDCRIEVVDVGVAGQGALPPGIRNERVRDGTADLTIEAAMSEQELERAMEVGERCARESVERGARLLIAGDMGIANTTAAACLICALTGAQPEIVVGRGTGLDDPGLARKTEVVATALARVMAAVGTTAADFVRLAERGEAAPLAWPLLAQVGGLEIAAMAGFYIEAARAGVIALLDGYISTAAALVAASLEPATLGWMLASHRSAEPGHLVALEALGLEPLIDLGMRLGEGSGAALTLPIVRAALALHRNMATFSEAGVAEAVDPDSVASPPPTGGGSA